MSVVCNGLAEEASQGVAQALRTVDCLTAETTATAFGRLFGANGALAPALTILLTLYIAIFAFSLLTGRSRLGISALTPRAITLGLVLTFATSWIAYQSVVWNLAVGAPDQIASVLTGSKGSATQIFADRIDTIFNAIAEVATESGQSAQGAGSGAVSGSFTPAIILWLGALLLLVATVGVLVTARIALAIMLAIGPVFIILGLFSGTRGLTVGWLRGLVLIAITPLFVVVGGGIVMELLVPIVSNLRSDTGAIDGRAAMALFLAAFVHAALMVLISRVATTTVGAWSVFGLGKRGSDAADAGQAQQLSPASMMTKSAAATIQDSAAATRAIGGSRAAFAMPVPTAPEPAATGTVGRDGRAIVVNTGEARAAGLPPMRERRARGIGSRYQPQPSQARKSFQ